MATSFDFGYANPNNFSDWANYAGFDRKTGTMAAPSADLGVAPPETFGELFEQKVAKPFSNTLQNVQTFGTNMSNAATQLGQGNAMGAFNASRGKPVAPGQVASITQPAQQIQQDGWALQSHVE